MLLRSQSLLGLHLLGFKSVTSCLQLDQSGVELCHSADGDAALGQLLGSLFVQLHQGLPNNMASQDNLYNNKSDIHGKRKGTYPDQLMGQLGRVLAFLNVVTKRG